MKGDILYFFTMYLDKKIGYAKIESMDNSLWKIISKIGFIGKDCLVGEIVSEDQFGDNIFERYTFDNQQKVLLNFFEYYHEYV